MNNLLNIDVALSSGIAIITDAESPPEAIQFYCIIPHGNHIIFQDEMQTVVCMVPWTSVKRLRYTEAVQGSTPSAYPDTVTTPASSEVKHSRKKQSNAKRVLR